MKKLKIYLSMLAIAGLFFTSCVDDKESASVSNLREAHAEQLKAEADYMKAKAAFETILANANAEKIKADVAAQNAATKMVEAQIKALEIENAIKEAAKQAEQDALIAKYEADLAKEKAEIQKQKNELEKALNDLKLINAKAEAELKEAEIEADIKIAELKYKLLQAQANADAQLRGVIAQYTSLLYDINSNQVLINRAQIELADLKVELERAKLTGEYNKELFIHNKNVAITANNVKLALQQEQLDYWKSLKVEDAETKVKAEEKLYADIVSKLNKAKTDRDALVDALTDAEDAYDTFIDSTKYYTRYYWSGSDIYPSTTNYYYSSYMGQPHYLDGTKEAVTVMMQAMKEDIAIADANYTNQKKAYADSLAKLDDAQKANVAAQKAIDEYAKTWKAEKAKLDAGDITLSAFKKTDSIYCDLYTIRQGGIANGGQIRPDGNYYPYTYAGKNHGLGTNGIYNNLYNYVNATNLTSLEKTLEASKLTYASLEYKANTAFDASKLAAVTKALNDAKNAYNAKDLEIADLTSQQNAKRDFINKLKQITSIYDIAGNIMDGGAYELAISEIKTAIENWTEKIVETKQAIAEDEKTIEKVIASDFDPAGTIALIEDAIANKENVIENLTNETNDWDKEAKSLKAFIDEATK